ncbi:MAG: SprT-like domain-containing protein [Gallionella sp.]|nr:SprT-like domain-containing protein [Gallionella sp.]
MNIASTPTSVFYAALQSAYDHFNIELFGGKLPHCLITLRSASRVYGYYHAGRFVSPAGEQIDEIGLHPGFFTLRPIESVLSTLVHEMIHHWQEHFGTPTQTNAHNQEWAKKMESLGLMPSGTGLPGGKKTGRSVSHHIIPDGVFLIACQKLVASGFAIPWLDRHLPAEPESQTIVAQVLKEAGIEYQASPAPIAQLPEEIQGKTAVYRPAPKKAPTREKLICPQCASKAWVSPETKIICGVCNVAMQGAGSK